MVRSLRQSWAIIAELGQYIFFTVNRQFFAIFPASFLAINGLKEFRGTLDMNRLISFLKYTAMSFIAAGMVVGLVFLELQTDFVSDVRVFLGMKEGRVSANSLAFSSREGLIDRVVNWRAYSGQNRHLPAPLRGWDRNEASGSPEAVRQFVKSVRPAVAEAKVQPVSAPAGLSKDQVEQIERAGQLNMAAHGFQTGAATYGNGDTKFIVVIRKVPNRFGGVLNRMSSVSALLDAFEDGAEQTIIVGACSL